MFLSVSVPYLHPGTPPSPLPTIAEIQGSTSVLSDRGGQKLVCVGNFVVRHGVGTNEREGNNLIFAQTTLGIPVPTVWAMFKDQGSLFIVMERIEGLSLQSIWASLSEEDKIKVVDKLRGILQQMRSFVPSQTSFFGSINEDVVPHHLFWTRNKDPRISGPFSCEHDFNMGLVMKLRDIAAQNNKPSHKADFYARAMNALHSHPSVFTHSDLQRKNIMVCQTVRSVRLGNTFDLVIVDWEDAGYYPSYWEYFCAFTAFDWNDDWPSKLELALESWPSENALLYMIYQELWF